MSTSPDRRSFIQTSAALGGLAFLADLPPVRAADTKPDPNLVALCPDMEPLVRLIEDTNRDKLLEEVGTRPSITYLRKVVRGPHAYRRRAARGIEVESGGKRQRGVHGGLRLRCDGRIFFTRPAVPQREWPKYQDPILPVAQPWGELRSPRRPDRTLLAEGGRRS